jgi:hypothetical protein
MSVGKELAGVALSNEIPSLGRFKPSKRTDSPPLGALGSPTSTNCRPASGSGLPDESSCSMTRLAIVELCDQPNTVEASPAAWSLAIALSRMSMPWPTEVLWSGKPASGPVVAVG